MKTSRSRLAAVSLALGLLVSMALAALIVFPAVASPMAQDILPTPTLIPLDAAEFTLEMVGGEGAQIEFTFEYDETDGITPGTATATSLLPNGMEFAINPQSANGDITDVELRLQFPNGQFRGFRTEFDGEQWVASISPGGGIPAWVPMTFFWSIRDTSGVSIETDMHTASYADPTRAWYRMESADVVVYWTGFDEGDQQIFAATIADTFAAHRAQSEVIYGGELGYRPVVVMYPNLDDFRPYAQNVNLADDYVGATVGQYGVVLAIVANTQFPARWDDCDWMHPNDGWPVSMQISDALGTATVILDFLYQGVFNSPTAPAWWAQGHARWNAVTIQYPYDLRLRMLAVMEDIPSLNGDAIGGQINRADGCPLLSFDVGASFINYLNMQYGGAETLVAVLEATNSGMDLYEALEEVTGVPFLDLENEWRSTVGFAPITLADLDPASALEPYEDSMLAEGDTVMLPATPMFVYMNEAPGPNALPSQQCFANTPVVILRMGLLEGVPYFEIDCMGMVGWVTREQLVGP